MWPWWCKMCIFYPLGSVPISQANWRSWNNTVWLGKNSHVTFKIQSECFISAKLEKINLLSTMGPGVEQTMIYKILKFLWSNCEEQQFTLLTGETNTKRHQPQRHQGQLGRCGWYGRRWKVVPPLGTSRRAWTEVRDSECGRLRRVHRTTGDFNVH